MCVFFTLNLFSARGHPLNPASLLILHRREIQALWSQATTQKSNIRQGNVMPSYWVRQAQHTYASNRNTLKERIRNKNETNQQEKSERKNETNTTVKGKRRDVVVVLSSLKPLFPPNDVVSQYTASSSTPSIRPDSSPCT